MTKKTAREILKMNEKDVQSFVEQLVRDERSRCVDLVRLLYDNYTVGCPLSRRLERLMRRIKSGAAPGGRP